MKRSKWSLTFFIWIWVQNIFQFRVKICNLTCASLHDTIIYRSRICTLPKQNKILDCTLVFLVRGLQLSESFTYKKTYGNDYCLYSVGASYFIGRFFASLFWGVVADRIGRKPIIIFSVASVWVQFSWI